MAMAGERRVRHRELGTSAESAAILAPVPTLQQRPADVAPLPGQDQYNFLLRNGVNASALERANAEAGRCGVATHEALLASAALSPAAYASALAGHLGVALASWRTAFDLGTAEEVDLDSVGLAASIGGRPFRVLCAEGGTPDALRQRAAALKARGMEVALAPRFRIEAALEKRWR